MSSKKSKEKESKQKEVVDVILYLSDNDSHFNVLSSDINHYFFPLANTPVIHYVMLKLIDSGFINFHIYPKTNGSVIKEYFKMMKYKDYGPVNIRVYHDTNEKSIGDIFRSIDFCKFDRNFLFLHGDSLININLQNVIDDFIKSNDFQVMSHIVTKQIDQKLDKFYHRCRILEIDNDTNYLYECNDPNKKEIICQHKRSNLHYDLYDPEMYICSKHVISQFHDNGDVHDFNSLIDLILAHHEFTNYSIKICILDDICVRLLNINMVFYISKLLLSNSLPNFNPVKIFGTNVKLTPSDQKILSPESTVYLSSLLKPNFKDSLTTFSGNVFVNYGVEFGDNCRIINSIIGANCKIGKCVIIENCLILNNVEVNDCVTIKDSLICSNSIIKPRIKIINKSIVDYGCTVTNDKYNNTLISNNEGVENFWDKEVKLKMPVETIVGIMEEKDEDGDFVMNELHNIFKDGIKSNDIEHMMVNITRTRNINDLSKNDLCVSMTEVFVNYPLREKDPELNYSKQFLQLCKDYGTVLNKLCRNEIDMIKSMLETVKDCILEHEKELTVEKLSDVFYSLFHEDIITKTEFLEWYNEYCDNLDDDEDEDREEGVKVKRGLEKFKKFLDENFNSDDDSEEESD